jgi:hypothetical protein
MKNNVLSLTSDKSGNDLALLDLQLNQSQTNLTRLKNMDIPSQQTITDGTTQRVAQVQSDLNQFMTQKISAQQDLDTFVANNKGLLTTDSSLSMLQDSITKSQANITSLQGDLVKLNQPTELINNLNQTLALEQSKLGQLKQQYQLEALEVLAVNQDRLESLKGQLAAEGSVGGAVKETTIGGYVVLVSQFAQQLTGLSDIWAENLKQNHQFTVEVSNLLSSNLAAFVGVEKFIEDNFATPYSDYVLNKIQLDEDIAIQETQVKYRDVLAKTVDDLQENIELQKKSVEQTDLLSVKLTHIMQLTTLETQFANLQNDYRLFDQKQFDLQNDYQYKVNIRVKAEQKLAQAQQAWQDFLAGKFYITSTFPNTGYMNGQTGDFNGDGKTDLIHFADDGHVNVCLSNGNGTFDIKPAFFEGAGNNFYQNSYGIGDFNGDGKTDLIRYHLFNDNNDNANLYADVWLSNGNGTFDIKPAFPVQYGASSNGYQNFHGLGDFNGDGKTDSILFFNAFNENGNGGTVYVSFWLSNGNGTFDIKGIAHFDYIQRFA